MPNTDYKEKQNYYRDSSLIINKKEQIMAKIFHEMFIKERLSKFFSHQD